MEEKAISVSQLSGYIKGIFDAEELLHNISVYGEISGLSVLRGNAYFSLKDENALLSCVFFGADESKLKNGDLIVATGTPRYYVKGGKLNFNVVKVEPYGVGELYKRFLETKDRLEREGLFLQSHKIQIPENVNKIGVVTSEKGAVIRDIINVSTRRNKSVNIVVFPSRVQGEGAEKDVIDGIKYFDAQSDVDVIIVARGGGSFEDLMPFNDETLARVVYNCEKPIVSAVGHETDFTIIDFVADLRAPTPSAAAELVVLPQREKILEITSICAAISNLLNKKCENAQRDVLTYKKDLDNGVRNLISLYEYGVGMSAQALEKLNPNKILERGYAKIEKNGENINSISKVCVKDDLEIYLKDGKLDVEVKNVEERNGK